MRPAGSSQIALSEEMNYPRRMGENRRRSRFCINILLQHHENKKTEQKTYPPLTEVVLKTFYFSCTCLMSQPLHAEWSACVVHVLQPAQPLQPPFLLRRTIRMVVKTSASRIIPPMMISAVISSSFPGYASYARPATFFPPPFLNRLTMPITTIASTRAPSI